MELSTGAVAGVVIACAAGGAILAAVASFLFWRPTHHLKSGFDALPRWAQSLYCLSSTAGDKYYGLRHAWSCDASLSDFRVRVSNYVSWMLNTSTPVQFDSEAFTRLAGPHADWSALSDPECDRNERSYLLEYFLCRAFFSRMIPECDASTTILPPDLLSTYQTITGFKFKAEPWRPQPENGKDPLNVVLGHFWRHMTTYWGTEFYSHLQSEYEHEKIKRPRCWGIRVNCSSGHKFQPEDSRLPNVIAFEETLKEVLAPFASGRHGDLESDKGRELLRRLTITAADLALLAFSEEQPMELFWPDAYRREGVDPNSKDGRLLCFGIRQLNGIPEMVYPGEPEPLKWELHGEPYYNDTEKIAAAEAWQRELLRREGDRRIRQRNGEPTTPKSSGAPVMTT